MVTKKLNVIAKSIGFKKLQRETLLVANGLKTLGQSAKTLRSASGGISGSKLPSGDIPSLLGISTKTKRGFLKEFDVGAIAAQNRLAVESMFSGMSKASKKTQSGILKGTNNLRAFKMEYLSTMFFGMQVWRTFSGIFKGMIDEYKKLDEKGQKPLTRSLTKMSAAFTFLKFSILDAMGPSLMKFIGFISDLALKISDMDPETLNKIGWGIGIIATAGLAMFTVSQVKLFADAVSLMLGLGAMDPSKMNVLGKGISKIGESLGGLSQAQTIRRGISLVAGITVTYKFLQDVGEMFSDFDTSLADRIKLGLTGTLAGALLGFSVGGIPGAIAGATIGFGVSLLVNLIDIGWENNWDEKLIEFGQRIKDWWAINTGQTPSLSYYMKDAEKKGLIGQFNETISNNTLGEVKTGLENLELPASNLNDSFSVANETLVKLKNDWINWTPENKTVNVTTVYREVHNGSENLTQTMVPINTT